MLSSVRNQPHARRTCIFEFDVQVLTSSAVVIPALVGVVSTRPLADEEHP
jgi:hypothetical protein